MASAIEWNVVEYDGVRFLRSVVYSVGGTPKNFTGHTARSHVRNKRDDSGTLLLDLSSYITLGVSGQIVIDVPEANFATLAVGSHYWSLVVEDAGGEDSVYFIGRFTVVKHPTGA